VCECEGSIHRTASAKRHVVQASAHTGAMIGPNELDSYIAEHQLDDVISERLRRLPISVLERVTQYDLSEARNASAILFMRCNRYEKKVPTPAIAMPQSACEPCDADPDEADALVQRHARSEKRRAKRANKLRRLDCLLDSILLSPPSDDFAVAMPSEAALLDIGHPLPPTGTPSRGRVDWSSMGDACDPFRVAPRMANTVCGQRKRETVEAFAWLIESMILPQVAAYRSDATPTIVDAGCSTGSLLLPLACSFPHIRFVGIDLKAKSLALLRKRASSSGLSELQVSTWEGSIEDYAGPCDALISLHACGGASDAALQLAVQRAPAGIRAVPFAVSPCCVGAVAMGPHHLGDGKQGTSARGAASEWLCRHLARASEASESASDRGADMFTQITAAADASAANGLEGEAATRQRRAKRVVEIDRLAAMPGEGLGGRMLRISGHAMNATSSLTDVLVGPPEALLEMVWPCA
jgi:SAM-dependent methyltransferase